MNIIPFQSYRDHSPIRTLQHNSEQAAVHEILATRASILKLLRVTNDTGTAGWVHVFDSKTAPQAGDKPVDRCPLPADGTVELTEIAGQKGLVVAISTTRGTYTASTNEAWFFAKIET
jgi:hypothetical protein